MSRRTQGWEGIEKSEQMNPGGGKVEKGEQKNPGVER